MTRHSEGLTAQSRFVYHSHPSPLWVPPVDRKCISVWWFWDPCFSIFRFSHCSRPQRHLSGIRWKHTFKKRKSYLEWYTALLCRCSWEEWITPPCREEAGQHSLGMCLGHIVSETQCLVSARGSLQHWRCSMGLWTVCFLSLDFSPMPSSCIQLRFLEFESSGLDMAQDSHQWTNKCYHLPLPSPDLMPQWIRESKAQ